MEKISRCVTLNVLLAEMTLTARVEHTTFALINVSVLTRSYLTVREIVMKIREIIRATRFFV